MLAPPPEPWERSPERPNLNIGLTVPSPLEVLNVQRNRVVAFTVPFSGEDGGERIIAQLWLNFGLEGQQMVNQKDLPPAEETSVRPGGGAGAAARPVTEREFQIEWTVTSSIPPGCQQLTFLLTNDGNISRSAPLVPIDPSLVGSLTWWVNVDAPDADQQDLLNCPVRKVGP